MRTKSNKKNKINTITLGCSKNLYDSEVLMGQLTANNIDCVHESDDTDANIVVVAHGFESFAGSGDFPEHFAELLDFLFG